MKLKFGLLKKPVYIIGAIVLFFIVLIVVNRRASSTSTTVAANSGPSDAAIAAGANLQMAQIGAGVQIAGINADLAKTQGGNDIALAIAQLQAGNSNNQITAEEQIAAANLAMQTHGLDLNYAQSVQNNQFALDYAREAYNYSLAGQAMSLDAFKISTDAELVSSLAGRNRYSSFALPAFFNATGNVGTNVQLGPNGSSTSTSGG